MNSKITFLLFLTLLGAAMTATGTAAAAGTDALKIRHENDLDWWYGKSKSASYIVENNCNKGCKVCSNTSIRGRLSFYCDTCYKSGLKNGGQINQMCDSEAESLIEGCLETKWLHNRTFCTKCDQSKGYFYSGSDGKCTKCAGYATTHLWNGASCITRTTPITDCIHLSNPTSSTCTTCKDGFKPYGTSSACAAVTEKSCTSWSALDQCDGCADGKYIVGKACVAITLTNCARTNNNTACTRCSKGYSLKKAGANVDTCVKWDAFTDGCAYAEQDNDDRLIKCKSCLVGYDTYTTITGGNGRGCTKYPAGCTNLDSNGLCTSCDVEKGYFNVGSVFGESICASDSVSHGKILSGLIGAMLLLLSFKL